MLPDSQIRLLQQSPGEFLAYDPPYILFGILFVAFGLFVVALMLFVTRKTGGWRSVYLVGYLAAVVFLLIGAAAGSTKAYISGSRASGEIQTRRKIFGVTFEGDHIQLQDVRSAKVEEMKNLRRVVLVLQSGQTVSLTSATDRDGYEDVAQAINVLLTQ